MRDREPGERRVSVLLSPAMARRLDGLRGGGARPSLAQVVEEGLAVMEGSRGSYPEELCLHIARLVMGVLRAEGLVDDDPGQRWDDLRNPAPPAPAAPGLLRDGRRQAAPLPALPAGVTMRRP